jgi:gliding motility-associated-like protein
MHKGKLYMVSQTNCLIRITLDPVLHFITDIENLGVLQTPSNSIYSLFSMFENCTDTEPSLFAIDNNLIFRINTDDISVTEVCKLETEFSFGATAISGSKQAVMPELIIPNVFTPNSDGYNDTYTISGPATIKSFRIMNRWGQTVYESEGETVSWKGTDSDGRQLEAGVYFYSAIIERCSEVEERHGFLSLVR